jgi:hypothetical protein
MTVNGKRFVMVSARDLGASIACHDLKYIDKNTRLVTKLGREFLIEQKANDSVLDRVAT